jgi:hypothetical protein
MSHRRFVCAPLLVDRRSRRQLYRARGRFGMPRDRRSGLMGGSAAASNRQSLFIYLRATTMRAAIADARARPARSTSVAKRLSSWIPLDSARHGVPCFGSCFRPERYSAATPRNAHFVVRNRFPPACRRGASRPGSARLPAAILPDKAFTAAKALCSPTPATARRPRPRRHPIESEQRPRPCSQVHRAGSRGAIASARRNHAIAPRVAPRYSLLRGTGLAAPSGAAEYRIVAAPAPFSNKN